MIIFGLQTPGVDPCQRVFWINVSICPAIEPNRILIDISPDARIVIAVPVVVQPGLLVVVLPRQPDALLDVVWVELLLDVAPGIESGGPDDLLVLIGECQRRAQMITVVMPHGDFSLLILLLFF